MTASPGLGARATGVTARPPEPARPLVATGAIGACAVTVVGLVLLSPLVIIGVASARAGVHVPAEARAVGVLWLAAHHVGFATSATGRVGLLPLGLLPLPALLLWGAGCWVARTGGLTKLSEAGYAALALAAPYAAVCGALALATRSPSVSPSVPQAALAGFLLGVTAGGLGAARALAPWRKLAASLLPRPRALLLGSAVSLAVLLAGGIALTALSLAVHWSQFRAVTAALTPGPAGGALLLLAELAYTPNAVVWAVCYCLGPGFAVGAHTVVAPTGTSVGPLPLFPLLAALPTAAGALPAWAAAGALSLPYLAGAAGGVLMARSAPTPALEAAPLWGFACGALTGAVIGLLAAFSGGPLGGGQLTEVGPSGWQSGLVAALEVGVAAAIAAGVVNWRRLRRGGLAGAGLDRVVPRQASRDLTAPAEDARHRIFVDPWGGDDDRGSEPPGPSALP